MNYNKVESAHLTFLAKEIIIIRNLDPKKRIIKIIPQSKTILKMSPNKGIKKSGSCHFYKCRGHYKVDYLKFTVCMDNNNMQEGVHKEAKTKQGRD